ncbi:metallophosphoesterase family protein [Roseomonas rosulenta]|uniref:metallophosphoesterase family protein n=1 Tax=Roseomonas rosulenta TaxID=2748667 RepID=UPI0018DF6E09|nr:DNA repair exonuclease [Roseomonas rosulenta]
MASFRFLHAADIHLDSPLHGLARYEGLPTEEIRGATRASFDNLINHAIDEKVDFVVIAGDMFDGDWKDMGTGLYFARAMGTLERAGILVYLLFGNHDAASVITKSVRLPGNVHQFGHRKPQTHIIEHLGVALHGQSFEKQAVTENMVVAFPETRVGHFNIGVLHTSLSGREGHASYAPCDVRDLRAKRYDYWALGHVHSFEIVASDPHVVFPGNIQGRNVRETGAKGAVIVDVVDREVVSINRIEVDAIRWASVEVDCTGADREVVLSRMRERLAHARDTGSNGRPMIARLVLTGTTEHAAGLRESAMSLRDEAMAAAVAISPELWIEKVQVRLREPETRASEHLPGDLVSLIDEAVTSEELANELRTDLAVFLSAVKSSLGEASDDDEFRHSVEKGAWPQVISAAASALRTRLAAEG